MIFVQEMDISFIVGDNIVFFSYDVAPDDFAKYFPQVQKMINSFQVSAK